MIKLHNISKHYPHAGQKLVALNNVSLSIAAGEVYGIIGHSGAGKSTLIRCLNLLEYPDQGEVWLDGVSLTTLKKSQLMAERRHIGMIFQHFNLLSSQTIFNNIAFPLRLTHKSRGQIHSRVMQLLELVGLTEQADKYPAQLSGGQKQRVGIARALANEPKLLLCDEATSALDPQTTQSILDLLRDINEKLNLTIVLITHEMEVIRRICHQVAILHAGEIIESGPVSQVFLHPQHAITQSFISDPVQWRDLKLTLQQARQQGQPHFYQITFTGNDAYAAHLSEVTEQTGVHFSILQGNIGHIRDLPYGQLVLELHGQTTAIHAALEQFVKRGLTVEEIK